MKLVLCYGYNKINVENTGDDKMTDLEHRVTMLEDQVHFLKMTVNRLINEKVDTDYQPVWHDTQTEFERKYGRE